MLLHLHRLIEEKIILEEVIKRGLMPSETEIQKYIDKKKENMHPSLQEFINKIMVAGNLTDEEYWDVYERYNIIRILAIENLSENVINQAKNNKILKKNKIVTFQELKKRDEQFKLFIKDLKNRAKVDVAKEYKEMGLKYEKEVFLIK